MRLEDIYSLDISSLQYDKKLTYSVICSEVVDLFRVDVQEQVFTDEFDYIEV